LWVEGNLYRSTREKRADMSDSLPPLRFDVGSVVLHKNMLLHGWFEGIVAAHWYRDPEWPPDVPTAPYVVSKGCTEEEEEDGLCAILFGDTDDWIRVLPEDLTPDPAKLNMLPEPYDPRSWEYSGMKNIAAVEDRQQLAAHIESRIVNSEARRNNPDGSLTLGMGKMKGFHGSGKSSAGTSTRNRS
jgi:hypothetical protein